MKMFYKKKTSLKDISSVKVENKYRQCESVLSLSISILNAVTIVQ